MKIQCTRDILGALLWFALFTHYASVFQIPYEFARSIGAAKDLSQGCKLQTTPCWGEMMQSTKLLRYPDGTMWNFGRSVTLLICNMKVSRQNNHCIAHTVTDIVLHSVKIRCAYFKSVFLSVQTFQDAKKYKLYVLNHHYSLQHDFSTFNR